MVSPEDKRSAVAHMRQEHGASERRACGLIGQPRSTEQYEAKPKPEDTLPKRIAELAAERPRFGYRRLTARRRVSVARPGASDHEGVAVASAAPETQTVGVLEARANRDYAPQSTLGHGFRE
jgi:hypothetical protein